MVRQQSVDPSCRVNALCWNALADTNLSVSDLIQWEFDSSNPTRYRRKLRLIENTW